MTCPEPLTCPSRFPISPPFMPSPRTGTGQIRCPRANGRWRTSTARSPSGGALVPQVARVRRAGVPVGGLHGPGNWATDLAGVRRRLSADLGPADVQHDGGAAPDALGALGLVTGRDLAQACRDAYAPRCARPVRPLRDRDRRLRPGRGARRGVGLNLLTASSAGSAGRGSRSSGRSC